MCKLAAILDFVLVRWQRTDGAVVRQKGDAMTPEAVRDHWNQITDFTKHNYPKTLQGRMVGIFKVHVYIIDSIR